MYNERIIMVKKDKLLEALRENRAAHEREYLEALGGYKSAMIDKLQENLTRLTITPQDEEFELDVRINRPAHNLDDYDRYIKMFEWEIKEEIGLTETEFRNLIQDEWSWTASFKNIHAMYTKA
jgi:hypothetical protein